MSETVTFRIDDRELTVPKGTLVLEAALDAGVEIPYFCYHPGLPVDGNCRMCQCEVEIGGKKRVGITCDLPAADGMVVDTKSDAAQKAQKDVMEFLLANHPLDCPECDQAGECVLQDHTFRYRDGHSRMDIPRRTKPHVNLGPDIALWSQRCILCTRCTRFLDEVSGTSELGIVDRGPTAEIRTFPGKELDSPLAGNVVDLCPVGALVSREFLYKARVWYLRRDESICLTCSRGCNLFADHHSNEIQRLRPRYNPAVNDWWMCDTGRHHYAFVHEDRMKGGAIRDAERGLEGVPSGTAIDAVARRIEAAVEEHGPDSVAAILCAWASVEDAVCLARLMRETVGSDRIGVVGFPDGSAREFKGGFRIAADRNPNRAGLRRVLGEADPDPIREGVADGSVKVLLVFDPSPGLPVGALPSGVPGTLVVFLARKTAWADPADLIVPVTLWAESGGTYENDEGVEQTVEGFLEGPADADPLWRQLVRLDRALGGGMSYHDVKEIREDWKLLKQHRRTVDVTQV